MRFSFNVLECMKRARNSRIQEYCQTSTMWWIQRKEFVSTRGVFSHPCTRANWIPTYIANIWTTRNNVAPCGANRDDFVHCFKVAPATYIKNLFPGKATPKHKEIGISVPHAAHVIHYYARVRTRINRRGPVHKNCVPMGGVCWAPQDNDDLHKNSATDLVRAEHICRSQHT